MKRLLLICLLAACAWGQDTPINPIGICAGSPGYCTSLTRTAPDCSADTPLGTLCVWRGLAAAEMKPGALFVTGTSITLAEPLDVPAIHKEFKQIDPCRAWDDPNCPQDHTHITSRWTCADPTRILEHDEENPARWWCRKVQP